MQEERSPIGDFFAEIGDWTFFALSVLRGIFTRHCNLRTLTPIFHRVGVDSAGVVAVTGLFIGLVLAVQTYAQFHQYGQDSMLGGVTNVSIVKEFGPVLAAVMLGGRIGSSMAAELATMRVTEQIDAIACLGINPIHYLAMPRFLACLLLAPLLTVLADLMGVVGSALICLVVYPIEPHFYWENARLMVGPWEILTGLVKAMFFGGAIGLIACRRGFTAGLGAEGVGRAATEAFVTSFIAVLLLDFFLVMFFYGLQTYLWG